MLILEAAKQDPLRAQEIEEKVSRTWWVRWTVNRRARLAAEEYAQTKGT